MSSTEKIRILIFIGNLSAGGKERRLLELLTYLKDREEYEFAVVMTDGEVHYTNFYELNIPFHVLPKYWQKYDITIFYKFFRFCQKYKPHQIHSWGRMQSLYALPAALYYHIYLINSQITSAPPNAGRWTLLRIIDKINFACSDIILSNSWAGLKAYRPPKRKSRVIYNGINMSRFEDLPDAAVVRAKYGLETPYMVLMSASFSPNKDHMLFLRVAKMISAIRDDITFVGVGGYDDSPEYKKLQELSFGNPRIIFPGRISDVEALINICTIGVLFSNKAVHGEGISNSIMEYMALAKPVIANDAGGTREIVHHNRNGYLIDDETDKEIAEMIMALVDDETRRVELGRESKKIILETFTLEKMGKAFEHVYQGAFPETAKERVIGICGSASTIV